MMMRMFLVTLMTTGLAATSLAAAEVPATMDVRMVAEHQQWAADHEKWHAEHLALAKRLEALAARLRTADTSFSDHGNELSTHLAKLAKPADAAALAAAHVRLASEHDDARIAHHELVDDVRHIEMLLEDDRKTEANEAPSPR
jgi:hypothetical protein